jgi:hypothetical protein
MYERTDSTDAQQINQEANDNNIGRESSHFGNLAKEADNRLLSQDALPKPCWVLGVTNHIQVWLGHTAH